MDNGSYTTNGLSGSTNWSFVSGALGSGYHTFTFRSTDVCGNTSNVDTLVLLIDSSNPTLGSISHADNTCLTTPFTLTGTSNDDDAVSIVNVQVNGGGWSVATGTSDWSYNSTDLAVGYYTFEILATDRCGNNSIITTRHFLVDEASPDADITNHSNDECVSTTFSLSGSANDDAVISVVQVKIDSGGWNDATGSTTWQYSSTPGAGVHTFIVRVTDKCSNTEVTDTVRLLVDGADPTGDIVLPAENSCTVSPLTLTGTSGDDVSVSHVQVSIDGGGYANASGTSNWTYVTPNIASGYHTLVALVRDKCGN